MGVPDTPSTSKSAEIDLRGRNCILRHTITIGAFEAFVTSASVARCHGPAYGAGKMAKTKKTARELAAMVMREVRASGKCSDRALVRGCHQWNRLQECFRADL